MCRTGGRRKILTAQMAPPQLVISVISSVNAEPSSALFFREDRQRNPGRMRRARTHGLSVRLPKEGRRAEQRPAAPGCQAAAGAPAARSRGFHFDQKQGKSKIRGRAPISTCAGKFSSNSGAGGARKFIIQHLSKKT